MMTFELANFSAIRVKSETSPIVVLPSSAFITNHSHLWCAREDAPPIERVRFA
jgi:hypothetical protein